MRNRIALLAPLLLAASPALAQEEELRAELLAAPKLAEDPVRPSFETLTPEALEASLVVVASRNYAFFGFNTPEIQLHLPAVANSTYARIDLMEPRLVDAAGRDVHFELERGLHDAETQIAEIRFLAEGGDAPAAFARAQGEIALRYPLEVSTRVVAAGAPDEVVRVDGPFVEVLEGAGVAEAPSFSPLEPVRAFDAEGRQLERASWSSSRFEGDRSWRGLAFHGAVARVDVDVVQSWADVEIAYDVPIAPLLPEARMGFVPDDPRAVGVGGEVRMEVAVAAARAPADAGPLPVAGEQVPVPPRSALSAEARVLSQALEALEAALPGPPAVVQLVVSPPAMVSISSETPDGVLEWTWRDGEVSGPAAVETRWLECREGMAAEALALQRIPALWDDAVRRVGGTPLQVVVGQYPCGTAYVNVPFDGGRRAQYEGDGRFAAVE